MHLLSSIGAATAALTLAVPAYATPPFRETFAFSQVDTQPCAGFEARVERNFTGRQTVYLDATGNPVRLEILAEMRGSATNSQSGHTLRLRGHAHVTLDLFTGAQTFIGQVFMATERGVGSVIKDTGRIAFDAEGNVVFDAGPHDVIDTDGAVFCTALA